MSIYADVFMTDFLGDEEVDLETDVRNTFSKWNAAPARNPILRATTSTDGDEIFVTTELMNYDIYGYTTDTYGAAPDYHITHAVIKFNTKIIWNRNYDYGCSQISPLMCAADARKVTMHEMGHAEGLGHQPASPDWNAAVMKQGALTYWTPRPDDLSGLTHIYGAYP